MLNRRRARFAKYAREVNQQPGQGEGKLTLDDMVSKLEVGCNLYLYAPYAFDGQGNPIGNNAQYWNGNSLPPLNQATQTALRNTIKVALQQLAAINDYHIPNNMNIPADNANADPVLKVNHHANLTTGELNRTNVANMITRCITAYRLYRGFKYTKLGRWSFDYDDTEMLNELSYLKNVLNGDVPNVAEPLANVINKLRNISQNIYTKVMDVAKREITMDIEHFYNDARLYVTGQDIHNIFQNLGVWTDPLSQFLNGVQNGSRYRVTDLVSVATDNLKVISLKPGRLSTTDVECTKNTVTIINGLMKYLLRKLHTFRYSQNQNLLMEIKRTYLEKFELFRKSVYTSIARSLGTMLDRTLDEYEYKRENVSPNNALVFLRGYQGLIDPADSVESQIKRINGDLVNYDIRPIENSVLEGLSGNTCIIKDKLNM